jgi:F1F0 ATPase subunit 2
MRETLVLLFALVAGIFLGTIFFGGLWWTVRRGVVSTQPALWFVGSMFLRTAIVVPGFYYVMQGDWRRLVACLAGFLLARFSVVRLTRSEMSKSGQLIPGGSA